MAVIVHGDNNGIAVDGDLSIEKLDFQFGKGVVAVEGVKKPRVEDAVIVEDEKLDDKRKVYPAVTDLQRNFFETAYTIRGKLVGQAPRVVELPVELLMHRIHDMTVDWNPVDSSSVRKWKLLYEVLLRLRYFRIEEKQRYRDFLEAVVKYCFPETKDSYNNNISKSHLDARIENWEPDDMRFYKELKGALSF